MMREFVIGQSPRPEIEAEIAAAPGMAIQLEGALEQAVLTDAGGKMVFLSPCYDIEFRSVFA